MTTIDEMIAKFEQQAATLRLVKQMLDDPSQRELIEQDLAARRSQQAALTGPLAQRQFASPKTTPPQPDIGPGHRQSAMKQLEVILAQSDAPPMTIAEMAGKTGVTAAAIRLILRRHETRFFKAGSRGKESLYTLKRNGGDA